MKQLSILLTGLLTTGTGLLLFAVDTVHGQNASGCYGNETGSEPICFTAMRRNDQGLKTWTEATAFCRNSFNGSTLPRIFTSRDQLALAEFLYEHQFTIDYVWLGAQGTSLPSNGWQWLNGDSFVGSSSSSPGGNDFSLLSFDYSVAVLTLDASGIPVLQPKPIGSDATGFICQQKNACTGNACFKRFEQSGNWFAARDKCILGNGDLATLPDTSVTGLNNTLTAVGYTSGKGYWVGLRKMWWLWAPETREHDGAQTFFLKVPKIENSSTASGNCLAVDYGDQFAWSVRDCSVALQVVCQTTSSFPTDSSSSSPSQSSSDVSLPIWAVGVISGCAGLFYILSLIIVAVIVYRCCRGKRAKKITKEKPPRGAKSKEVRYVEDPVTPNQQQQPPRKPPPMPPIDLPSAHRHHQHPLSLPSAPSAPTNDDYYDDFDDDDDEEEYQNDIPPPRDEYMNHSQAASRR